MRTSILLSVLFVTMAALPASAQTQETYGGAAYGAPSTTTPYATPSGAPVAMRYSTPSVPTPIPTSPTVVRSAPTMGLLIPGVVLFGLGWLPNVLSVAPEIAALDGVRVHPDWAYVGMIPLIGPFIQLGFEDGYPLWSVISGAAQVAGLTLFILGLVIRDEWEEPAFVFDSHDPRSPRLSFSVEGAPGGAIGTLRLAHF